MGGSSHESSSAAFVLVSSCLRASLSNSRAPWRPELTPWLRLINLRVPRYSLGDFYLRFLQPLLFQNS